MELNITVGHIFFHFLCCLVMAQKGLKLSYLEALVVEILSLTVKELFDSYKQAPFNLKIDVLSNVLDHPGVGKVFNLMGSGAKRFKWCEIKDKCHLG